MTMTQCSIQAKEIKLIWRPAPHQPRLVVGTLSRDGDTFRFRYDGPDIVKAKAIGFDGYPGMRALTNTYNGQAMSSFAARLPSRDRPDFDRIAEAWRADPKADDFTLLGLTGGRLPTDMFEFVPVIEPIKGTCFLSELAGIDFHGASEAAHLRRGEVLQLQPEPSNQFDANAVAVIHGDTRLGYIKRVHCDSIVRAMVEGLPVSCCLERMRVNGKVREMVVEIGYQ